MAHTAHSDQRMMEELQMSPQELDAKCTELAALINKTDKIIFFSGAGLSTASDIGDYRSSTGLWTLKAQGRENEFKSVPLHLAKPNLGHMALVEFQNRNKLSCVISQNVDGLHLKSGILPDNLCELHGNSTLEECSQCGKLHHRDICISGDAQHYTGRFCVACSSTTTTTNPPARLRDTIINFGENLNPRILEKAYDVSRKGELHICIGSSLGVSPACDLPRETKRNKNGSGGKMVIVNLQRTPLDNECDIRFHCKINDFFECLFSKLGWKIPDWTYRRQVSIINSPAPANNPPTLRFCATQPFTSIPSSSFGKITLVNSGDGDGDDVEFNIKTKDFTRDASAMNDICPTFDYSTATITGLTFSCESFFMKERKEPGVVYIPFQCAEQMAATFIITSTFSRATGKFSEWNVEQVDSIPTPAYAPAGAPARNLNTLRFFPDFNRGLGETRAQGVRSSSGKDKEQQQDYSGWFAVTPMSDCPHTNQIRFSEGCIFDLKRPCEEEGCKNVGENMMCFTCGAVFCGRHVHGHMLNHNEKTKHPIVCGFADLSVWCYECEQYLNESNSKVAPLHRLLYAMKFGSDDPQVMINSNQDAADNNNKSSSRSKRNKPTAPVPNGDDDDDEDADQQKTSADAAPAVIDTKYKEVQTEKRSGFAANPVPSCPHTNGQYVRLQDGAVFDIEAPCTICGNVGENWICLRCNKVYCSRFVNGCMQKHFFEETNQEHPLCISFSDLSCWCNSCSEYINPRNATVAPMNKLVTLAKFGDEE